MGEPASPRSSLTADEGHAKVHDAELQRIYRKIDWRILPLMFLCYFLQFLDKVLVNYANIMGFQQDLHFKPGEFQWMATALFIGYTVAEFPQGYLIQRFPLQMVLGVNVLLWGLMVCCTAAAQDFVGATVVRTLLGMLESVIAPALVMITTQWYTKRQATPRMGIWYCGLGAGQIIGGLISWAAQHGSKAAVFPGWKIMFVAVGAFNVLVALCVMLVIPRDVQAATFLDESEKKRVQVALSRDQAGNGPKVFQWSGVKEAFLDLQVWLLFLDTMLTLIPSGVITTFSATLIRGFKYTAKEAALLNMPSGAVSIFATLVGSYAILYDLPRWLSIIALLVLTMVGAGLMSFYSDSKAAALAGIYLLNFDVAPLALLYALAGANTHGYTKKVVTMVMVSLGVSFGNIIGPQTFRPKDAPEFLPAKIVVFVVAGGSIVVTILLRVLYGVRNAKTAAARKAELAAIARGEMTLEEKDDLSDMTNPAFRYVY